MRLRSIAPQGFWALKSQGFRNAIRFRPDSESQPLAPKTKRSGCGIDCAAIPSGVSQGLLLGGPYVLRWLLSGTKPPKTSYSKGSWRGQNRQKLGLEASHPPSQSPYRKGQAVGRIRTNTPGWVKPDPRLASRGAWQFVMVAWKGTSNVQGKEATTIQSGQRYF